MRNVKFQIVMFLSLLCLAFVFTPSSVKAQTSLSDLSDEQLLRHVLGDTDYVAIAEQGMYVQKLMRVEGGIFQASVLGPDWYYTEVGSYGTCAVFTPLANFGYYNYLGDKKIVQLCDSKLRKYNWENGAIGRDEFEFDPNEELTYRYEKDGMLFFGTRAVDTSFMENVYSIFGLGDVDPDIIAVKGNYAIELSTGRIKGVSLIAEYKDNRLVSEPFYQAYYNYYTEKPNQDELVDKLYNDVFGGEKHTITVIVGLGTDRERQYSIAASKDAYLYLWITDINNSYTSYDDTDYTQITETCEDGTIKFDRDKTIYLK